MWKVEHIHAENFSAFKELNYSPLQGHATLIFGHNLDNDSQKSNGSGKSALIEAIAVGLTGATLRNIKTEEIINDNSDTAIVIIELVNDFFRKSMKITRTLSRKDPQVIHITETSFSDTDIVAPHEVPQASVADYNKYILDALGLSKDDIYANYILCKHKYQSFLSSSDKDKKEIINRFSNGIMVDESIAALQADMLPIEDKLQKAIGSVNVASGKVTAIEEQIQDAIEQSENRWKSKVERVQGWRDAIVQKREAIRSYNEDIRSAENNTKTLTSIAEQLEKLEAGESGAKEMYEAIKELFSQHDIQGLPDFAQKLADLEAKLGELKERDSILFEEAQKADSAYQNAEKECETIIAEYEKFQKRRDLELPKVNEEIATLLEAVKKLESINSQYKKNRLDYEREMAQLRKELAGVIVCPKCKFEFTLSNTLDIEEAREKLADLESRYKTNESAIQSTQEEIDSNVSNGVEARKRQNQWGADEAEWSGKVNSAKVVVNRAKLELETANSTHESVCSRIAKISQDIKYIRADLFDSAFAIIDQKLDEADNTIIRIQGYIKNAEGSIESYEESIAEIEHASENNVIDTLKENKEKYQEELQNAIAAKEKVDGELNEYKTQEATFVEFKTHLANTKIEALSHITNEFLEAIGSDIRIAFSGFTVLKSGKVRDKISISLLRDGINCGSFDKFSEGEKARVNLANILAMHKLTNVSCPEGKGLNLLVIDEILDATDESGLANIFESLNNFQITSLVVSHGLVQEGYSYKLVVCKENGVSRINE